MNAPPSADVVRVTAPELQAPPRPLTRQSSVKRQPAPLSRAVSLAAIPMHGTSTSGTSRPLVERPVKTPVTSLTAAVSEDQEDQEEPDAVDKSPVVSTRSAKPGSAGQPRIIDPSLDNQTGNTTSRPNSKPSVPSTPQTDVEASGSPVQQFTLLLIEEFLKAKQLTTTATALQQELAQSNTIPPPDADMWFEMYPVCRPILAKAAAAGAQRLGSPPTTLEQLIEFCVNPVAARRHLFSLDVVHSAASPVAMCASPKKPSSVHKSTPSGFTYMNAHMQTRSPIVRPSRRPSRASSVDGDSDVQAIAAMASSASASVLERAAIGAFTKAKGHNHHHPQGRERSDAPAASSPERDNAAASPSPFVKKQSMKKRKRRKQVLLTTRKNTPAIAQSSPDQDGERSPGSAVSGLAALPSAAIGTYGEPALVSVLDSELKRDLSSLRVLDRELRKIRIEKITEEPKRPTQKKLGHCTFTPEEEALAKKDPYLYERMLERFGFAKRTECALCGFSYLSFNLPHRVSFKAVMDVHALWHYEPPDKDAAKYKPPLCYDSVSVCRMCAQIVFQFAKQPPNALSKHKAKSVPALHSPPPDANDSRFSSDPYALPPLSSDDCYDHLVPQQIEGEALDEQRATLESPAKAIVYAGQMDNTHFMTSKEWEVINPERSNIRQVMESTVLMRTTDSAAAGASPGVVATTATGSVRRLLMPSHSQSYRAL